MVQAELEIVDTDPVGGQQLEHPRLDLGQDLLDATILPLAAAG